MTLNLATLKLSAGGHESFTEGMCLMEAASMLIGDKFGDNPRCVSPVIRHIGIALNDTLPTDLRQRLVPFVPLVVDTADNHDDRRKSMLLDWMVREYAARHYDLLPETIEYAIKLRELPAVYTADDLNAAISLFVDASKAVEPLITDMPDGLAVDIAQYLSKNVWSDIIEGIKTVYSTSL